MLCCSIKVKLLKLSCFIKVVIAVMLFSLILMLCRLQKKVIKKKLIMFAMRLVLGRSNLHYLSSYP